MKFREFLEHQIQKGKIEWENIKEPNPPIWQILLKINELRYQVKNV